MATDQTIQRRAPATKPFRLVRVSSAAIVAGSLVLAFLIFATWAWGGFDWIRVAYGYITGETILVDSHTKSFGVIPPGGSVTVTFKLTNLGHDAIRIVGCRSGCPCMVPDDLPFVLHSKESRDFTVSIGASENVRTSSVKTRRLRLTLFTTNPSQSQIPLTVSGESGQLD